MFIKLPGWSYKQYTNEQGEIKESVYKCVFEIDVDSIEAFSPSTGPLENPETLPYSRIMTKSGRMYDIRLKYAKLRERVWEAKKELAYQKLISISN
jgi:hypothetical protein